MHSRRSGLSLLAAAVVTAATVVAGSPLAHAADGPALTVDATVSGHPISQDVYGMNFADAGLAQELKLPVDRWGGNATTRYNYLTSTSNRASDWYFENIPDDVADPAALPDGSSTDQFVEKDQANGSQTIMTVPLIGWIPKDRAKACGFSVEKYGPQASTDQWAPDCGNGVDADGKNITGNDPTDTSTPAGGDYVKSWIGHLGSKYGWSNNGGVKFYDLDNEADIWHATHRDVHPEGAGYDEMRDRTYSIADAVKAADQSAKTLGPVGWGWNSIMLSGLDQKTCNEQGGDCWSNPPDQAAHDGVPYAEWYLQQMAAYQKQHGLRILDYYDNHWYPQGTGVTGGGEDDATQALRLRSTRQLWDPEYTDESWINQKVDLIPRMRQLVDQNYPGTKIAISEYNYGALDHIDGGLAEADVLGIFGREGLDLATLWSPPAPTDPGAFAFRMYLDYDGKGSKFGDTSLTANTADADQVSVFASRRSSDGALTLMLVNKSTSELTTPLSIKGLTGDASAQVFQYSGADTSAIQQLPDQAIAGGQASLTLPGYSITELVVPAAGQVAAQAHTDRTDQAKDASDTPVHEARATQGDRPVPPAHAASTRHVHPVTSSTLPDPSAVPAARRSPSPSPRR
ncbi:glycoside hydrolase family 44 protein [Streptomyces odontomachi]|uniref:glycoside hydrolase family 44 protein n=1 Tax=Streptomyces odontomachi TaxID=2944940 RepID=UPI00210D35E3|nr:glycoside hydrolase family 44 protein [Streptomyces sp. ODS25]